MSLKTYHTNTKLSNHFMSYEFVCPHCKIAKIDSDLIYKLEELFRKLHASKCIISSGYRCRDYDIQMNGFAGRHSEGLAVDCCYYDRNGKVIPSKVVCCVAFDLGFSGIAYINDKYVHLDIRKNGTYYGDETRGNSSYWKDPYQYFGVSRSEVQKYTGDSSILYQVYTNRWLPNVMANSGEYAGIFGRKISRVYIDQLVYRVRSNGKWLPAVRGRSDYAGYSNGSGITDIAIKGARYRVHVLGSGWLGWVNGYDIHDYQNGYAGNGKLIDALEIKM